jgi:hypothetical protein
MLKNYLTEIISKKQWQQKNHTYRTTTYSQMKFDDYKINLKMLKQIFTKLNNGKFKSTIILDYDKVKADYKKLNDTDKFIIVLLKRLGYEVSEESYILGFAKKEDGKNILISNILDGLKAKNLDKMREVYEKTKNPNLERQIDALEILQDRQDNADDYNGPIDLDASHPYVVGNEKKFKIVLSIQPRLIASQSTEVGWTSCMNLDDGINKHMVGSGISAGVIVAYLVKNNDTVSLDHPVARVLIKPLVQDKHTVWTVDKIYGTAPRNI